MNKISIKKDYFNKIKLLNKYNKFYYDKSNPIVSDNDYDILKKNIIEIEKKYPKLINKESPSLKVGFKPSKNFKKIKHKIPMLSLNNAFNKEDLKNLKFFFQNLLNLLH